MDEKPRLVITRSRRPEPAVQEFPFAEEMLPAYGALDDARRRAWEIYRQLPMPTGTEEAWRRTDLRSMPAASFRFPAAGAFRDLAPLPPALLQSPPSGRHGGQVVLLPGGARASLDPALFRQNIFFTDLRNAERENPQLVARMAGELVRPEEGKFAALAAAFAHTGVVLYVPKGVHIEQPLQSILWGPGAGLAFISRLLLWVDEGASLTFIHEAASPDESAASLHAGSVEIKLGDDAQLTFVELQSWGRHVWNFSHERIQLGRGARLDWVFGSMGSRLTKTFSTLDLAGEGATGRVSGFYFADGEQHLDHDTRQNHLAPRTTSDLLFKGALKGNGRSVWRGMIYVAAGAQKADGYQANRNLILSPTARADSIPGLEILADDVRCTHGATVSKLEAEPLFYLKSRGIPKPEAERLLVDGFFEPVMQRIPLEEVRARFQQAVQEKMADGRIE